MLLKYCRTNLVVQKTVLSILCALMLSGVTVFAYASDDVPKTITNNEISVTTSVARQVNWAVTIAGQGEVLPWEVAIISAKTAGVAVTQVNLMAGDSVKKDQVLVRFDQRLLQAQYNQAQANVAFASANLQLAKSNLARAAQLKNNKTLSAQDFDAASNQASTATASEAQAQAALVLAKIKLEDAVLIAPDDGKILARNIELGAVPQTGEPLFTLLCKNKLQWAAQINADAVFSVKAGMAAQIILAGKIFKGVVRSVSPQLNSASRLGEAHIVFDGEPELAANTYAEGSIILSDSNAVVAPAESIVVRDGKTWVFRVNNGVAEQILVSIGRRQNHEVELLTGIHVGDSIVLEGAGFLNNGDRLNVKPLLNVETTL